MDAGRGSDSIGAVPAWSRALLAIALIGALPGCGRGRPSNRQACEAYWTRSYECRDRWMPGYWTGTMHRSAASYRADPRPPALRAQARCAADGTRRPLAPERLACLDATSCEEMGACERAYETR